MSNAVLSGLFIDPPTTSIPTITWANPANIVYGTALSATQLDATANVPGTFAYTPAAGTVLTAGNDQTLSVTFTPTDTTDYTTATATAFINVLQATPTITWANPANIVYGTALSANPARRHGQRARHLRLHAGRGYHPHGGQRPDAVGHLHSHRHHRLHHRHRRSDDQRPECPAHAYRR